MARYFKYHAANGYGFVKKGRSLPLATGSSIHEALAEVLILHKDGKPTSDEVYREIIQAKIKDYQDLIKSRGFLHLEDKTEVLFTMHEQSTLIEGLYWGWIRVMLPELLRDFEILDVEREEAIVHGCSCGNAGSNDISSHSSECSGILQQARPDFLARRRAEAGGNRLLRRLSNHDFKTAAYLPDSYVDEYRESIQMAIGCKAAELRLGEKVDEYYIHAIIKGTRRPEYSPETSSYSGPIRQNSFICYGYHRHANPPLQAEDWQPKFKYVGQDGKNHTLGKYYTKEPIWEAEFNGKPAQMSNVEYWVKTLPVHYLNELFVIIGPYPRPDHLLKHYEPEMVAHEKEWIEKLWKLYEAENLGGDSEELAHSLIPRSWNCHHYGMPCEYLPICFGQEKDPLGSGKYGLRRPHHKLELDQMKERGVEIPPEEGEENEVI